jgi:Phage capsid protein
MKTLLLEVFFLLFSISIFNFMATTAFNSQIFIQEAIPGFESQSSDLRRTVHTVANIRGTSATFLVADSGSAVATTRGADGLIPARPDSLTQSTATLTEYHDLVRKTEYTIDFGQADQRQIAIRTTNLVINKKIDYDIIGQLDTATNQVSATADLASLSMVAAAMKKLGENGINPNDSENLFAVVTPAFYSQLMQIKEFTSSDYVDVKPMAGGMSQKMKRWFGVNWIQSNLLTGMGTATEKCYIYHRDAIGHAIDKATFKIDAGFNDEQAYYWVRASANMGSKMLQQGGVVQLLHTGNVA